VFNGNAVGWNEFVLGPTQSHREYRPMHLDVRWLRARAWEYQAPTGWACRQKVRKAIISFK